jgi:hypothetical protein
MGVSLTTTMVSALTVTLAMEGRIGVLLPKMAICARSEGLRFLEPQLALLIIFSIKRIKLVNVYI